ncbi:MAG: SsrA-binding protein SmpB [Oligoflexus sp.]|jgi:SsrA-binding protein
MESKGIKVIGSNRKAFHEYSVGDKWEAGLSLQGTEVKALRDGRVNLSDGWIDITDKHEAILREVHIGHYSHGNIMNHEERRPRRLLLHRHEIDKLARAVREKGFTLLPLKIYFKGRHIKLELGLGKGKKSHDKREAAREKDAKKEISRAMKDRRR